MEQEINWNDSELPEQNQGEPFEEDLMDPGFDLEFSASSSDLPDIGKMLSTVITIAVSLFDSGVHEEDSDTDSSPGHSVAEFYLQEYFPKDGVVSATGLNYSGISGRDWYLETGENSYGFLHSFEEEWSSSLALVENNEVIAACIFFPETGVLYFADKIACYKALPFLEDYESDILLQHLESGNFTLHAQKKKIELSKEPDDFKDIAMSSDITERRFEQYKEFYNLLLGETSVRSPVEGPTAVPLLIEGNIDAWVTPLVFPWETLAAEFIIKQAGGRVASIGDYKLFTCSTQTASKVAVLIAELE